MGPAGQTDPPGRQARQGIGAARSDSGLPEDELSTADWVRKYTKNDGVHGIFRNMCASVFAVSSENCHAVFTYFPAERVQAVRFSSRGDHRCVESVGGGIHRTWRCARAVHRGDQYQRRRRAVIGVTLSRDGQERTVTAPIVVSDVGPFATIGLAGEDAFDDDYVKLVNQRNRPCAMLTINFASQEPLIEAPGMLSFSSSRRLAYIANFTDSCPRWRRQAGTRMWGPRCLNRQSAISTRPPKSSCCVPICATRSPIRREGTNPEHRHHPGRMAAAACRRRIRPPAHH